MDADTLVQMPKVGTTADTQGFLGYLGKLVMPQRRVLYAEGHDLLGTLTE